MLRRVSIKIKMLIGLFFVSAIGFIVVGYFSSSIFAGTLEEFIIDNMQDEVRETAEDVKNYLESLHGDVLFLKSLPPVEGIIRAKDAGGYDPNSNSSLEQWKDRLADIYLSFMGDSSRYLQIRYIDEFGNEVVRVNYRDGNVNRVDEQFLQNKKDRYYFIETISSVSEGGVYISNLDLNREDAPSEIVLPRQPTIRYATPVFDSNGKNRGIVVINVRADLFLERVQVSYGDDSDSIVMFDREGYYVSHYQKEKMFGSSVDFNTGYNIRNDYPDIYDIFLSGKEGFFEISDKIVAYTPVFFDPLNKNNFWVLKKDISKNVIFSVLDNIKILFFIVSILSLSILILLGYILSTIIVSPIKELSRNARKFGEGDFSQRANVKSGDEVGELARAFNKMADQVERSESLMQKEIKEKTKELSSKLFEIGKLNVFFENRRKAVLNILEDTTVTSNELSQEKEKLKTMLESIGDAVMVINRQGFTTFLNPIAESFTGFEEAYSIGKHYRDILKLVVEGGKESDYNFIEKSMKEGVITKMENNMLLITKKGIEIPVSDSTSPIYDSTGEVVGAIIVFRDASHERVINKMKTEFVSIASHQLRTPLTAIRWYTEELSDPDFGELTEKQRDYLKQTHDSVVRLTKLVNGLLNMSRLETGRMTIKPEPTDIVKLVKNIISNYEVVVTAKNCTISLKKPRGESVIISIDPELIGEVFSNLIANATNYSFNDKKKCGIYVIIKKTKVAVEVSVKDTGIGIPKKDQPRIFEKFFRSANAIKTTTTGSGLGLYVSKYIVESTGGKIWFTSKEGEGTTFTVSLPLKGGKSRKGETGVAK